VNSAVTSSLPTITSVSVNNITPNSASINGIVNANNSTTTCSIEYGTTVAYGNTTPTTPSTLGGIANTAISASVSSLSASTSYHYRIKASNANGTVYSNDAVFITYPSSVAETTINNALFFPNPCTNVLLYTAKETNTHIKFAVFNTMGQYHNVPTIHLGQGRYQLETTQLSTGIYRVVIQGNNLNEHALFLKQ
jgi:hypothetical protein